jgi:hypothetical protein
MQIPLSAKFRSVSSGVTRVIAQPVLKIRGAHLTQVLLFVLNANAIAENPAVRKTMD